jgi:hypothetical protein
MCGRVLKNRYIFPKAGGHDVDCVICGGYRISSTLEEQLAKAETRVRFGEHFPFLRAHTRQAADVGEVAELTLQNYESIAKSHMTTLVETQLRRALDLVAARSRLGEWVKIDLDVEALRLDARESEAALLFEHLEKQGWLEHLTNKPPYDAYGAGTPTNDYRLTVAGWQIVSPLVGGGRTGTAFVAMSFDESMADAYDAIRAAVEDDCGLEAHRVDRVEHNDQITDRIMAGIRSAQFTIADFTGQRQGVYFEAGFAMGLGRAVIWCCRKDEITKVHFDTRQFSHVVWSDPEDLRRRLTDRIRGTILTPVKLA